MCASNVNYVKMHAISFWVKNLFERYYIFILISHLVWTIIFKNIFLFFGSYMQLNNSWEKWNLNCFLKKYVWFSRNFKIFVTKLSKQFIIKIILIYNEELLWKIKGNFFPLTIDMKLIFFKDFLVWAQIFLFSKIPSSSNFNYFSILCYFIVCLHWLPSLL